MCYPKIIYEHSFLSLSPNVMETLERRVKEVTSVEKKEEEVAEERGEEAFSGIHHVVKPCYLRS